ncbi:hypothetical protein Anas_06277 [Armadillidium nasatum]|uniref:Uncharacterized protein n=1 Tax=Armadillidium nasatum TaxID=96803 RepID=A0A5N5STS8_9CRUS|nr:hypothetical protein Anas_06277 [Armadillidium nasatum]
MRIIGPIFIVLGIIMSLLGWGLFAISRKISRNEKEQRLLNSALQLCQLENTFKRSKVQQTNSSNLYTLTAPTQDQSYPVLSLRRGSFWIEPTPVEYPQIPPEGEYPSYNRRGSRSSSPLMDSGVVVWSQQNSVVEKPHLQTQNSLYQTPYHQTLLLQNQQLLPKQVQQQITTARLSSPLLNYYYGTRDYASDIATFPIESYIPVSCPLKVQSKQESDTESKERNSPPPHPHSHPPSCSNSASSSASSHASSKKKLTDQATSNSKESGDSCMAYPKESNLRCNHSFPKSQNNWRVTAASATVSTEETTPPPVVTRPTFEPVSTNLPLTRNGVAIPRLSRHS